MAIVKKITNSLHVLSFFFFSSTCCVRVAASGLGCSTEGKPVYTACKQNTEGFSELAFRFLGTYDYTPV